MPRHTVVTFRDTKRTGAKIAVLTAYDHPSAAIMDGAGVDAILVGDSLGNVLQGQATTLPVTMEHMEYHTACVARGAKRAFIATDMPIRGRSLKSYPIDEDTVLDFIDGDLATIHFATERKRGKNGTYTVNIGFERIENGREVYKKFRDVQRSAA